MKKLKNVVIAWVSIYPAITLILRVFGNTLNHIPLMLRTLVLTAILVPLMIYVLVPFWTKVFTTVSQSHVLKKIHFHTHNKR